MRFTLLFRYIIPGMIITVFIAGLSYFSRSYFHETELEKSLMTLEQASDVPSRSDGESLAKQHCIACHEFTPPDLLNKKSWNFLLTYMGLRLGIEDYSFVNNPTPTETRVLEARSTSIHGEGLFPETPAMSASDWRQLRDYYQKHSPTMPLKPVNKPQTAGQIDWLRPMKHHYDRRAAVVSMVRIDPAHQQLLVAEATRQDLTILDKDLDLVDSIANRNTFWVDAEFTDEGVYLLSVGDISGDFIGQKLGKVAYGRRLGDMYLTEGLLLKNLYRPADMLLDDMNQNGQQELVVCNFGDEGGSFEIYPWNDADKAFDTSNATVLYTGTGPIQCKAHDFNKDGWDDLIVLVSDVKEHISIYLNNKDGTYSERIIASQSPSWGYVGLEIGDIDNDGDMDIITGNGDNGDSDPYNTLKRYHGVHIYENKGNLQFDEVCFYPMYGCYYVKVADFDMDGDLDIAANAFHPDFNAEQPENFVLLLQTSPLKFEPYHIDATQNGRWMTMDAGDIDGDGDVDIVLGAAYVPIGLSITQQKMFEDMVRNGPTLMVLENTIIH